MQMKAVLAAGFVFIFGISVYESFMAAQDGTIPMPGPGESLIGGHALLCVGYDNGTQRFTFRNSWSTNWPEKPAQGIAAGYGTIPYNYLTDGDLASDLWVVQSVSE
jgi:C1A family cysteine protease